MPAADPRGLVAWGPDGVGHPVAVSWTGTGRVVSLEVARDGARVLVQLETGPGRSCSSRPSCGTAACPPASPRRPSSSWPRPARRSTRRGWTSLTSRP
ncbi:hypothetical protein [Clavibacter capsici]|uniref:hypothetical protein n=1 Tax=Clavibacter capsici TaxID=1874630 RepID=UPI00211C7313|nr:hypothetical protein [Clavibacter capsici]